MRIFSNNQEFPKSKRYKNYVIVLGIGLGLFTITSFEGISNERQSTKGDNNSQVTNPSCDMMKSTGITDSSNKDTRQKTHHNFIASYLLEESSAKKEVKDSDTEIKLIGKFMQLHKTIVTNVFNQL